MVLDALKSFFLETMNPSEEATLEEREPDIRLAACALLVELAWADDDFTDDERRHLEEAIRRHFQVSGEWAETLLAHAEEERRRANDLWHFTTLIRQHYSTGQKMVLAEIMWGLVYSDGELSSREEYLMRKISHLLDLKIGYLSAARDRVRGNGDDPGGVD